MASDLRSGAPRPAGAPARTRRVDLALLAVAVAGVSLSAPLTTLLEAPVLTLAVWRTAVGAAILLPVALVRDRGAARRAPARAVGAAVLAGVLLAAHFAAWLPSLTMTSVAASTALVATTPVWVAVALWVTGTRFPGAVWGGLALAVLGVGLVAGVDARAAADVRVEAQAGDGLALAGAVSGAGYVLLGARARVALPTAAYAVACYATAAVVLAAAAALTGAPFTGLTGRDWWLIAAITACAQLAGHTVLNLVVPSVGPTAVGLALLLEVPGAALLALVLLGQAPPPLALPGVVAVLAGVAVVVRAGGGSPPPRAGPPGPPGATG